MSPSLVAACVWVLTGAAISPLPIRYQMIPGIVLLLTAVPLMIWIGWENGWLWTAIGLAAFLSMFRRPLLYFIAKARGRDPERPR